MIRILIRRLLLGILTVASVYTLTFLMVVVIPGNPFQSGERTMAPEIVQALRARYAMDNTWLYYWQFLEGAVRLDFGPSFAYNDWTCGQIIASALPISMAVGLLAMIVALVVGVLVGTIGAVRRSGAWDVVGLGVVMLGVSVPTFVTGSLLLTVFGVWLRWAPVGGWGTLGHLPLPALTLSLPYAAYIARLTRASMIEALSSDFVRTALAKGATRRQAVLRHALKVAMLPVLSFLGPATAQAMTGSFVVEKVFGVPGLGQHFVNAALNRDVGLIMGTVLVFSSVLVLFNLAIDLLYAWMDPRISEAA